MRYTFKSKPFDKKSKQKTPTVLSEFLFYLMISRDGSNRSRNRHHHRLRRSNRKRKRILRRKQGIQLH